MELKNRHLHIDNLRGLTILLVFFYHLKLDIFSFGYIGVDIFFVISGFLITEKLQESFNSNTYQYKAFLLDRVFRLVPVLSIILLFTYICGLFYLSNAELISLSKQNLATTFFLQNIYLSINSGYFEAIASSQLLTHMWSLSIEGQYYLLWPIIFYYLNKKTYIYKLSACILIFIISFALCIYISGKSQIIAFYMPFTRVWEFLAGTLAYFSLSIYQKKSYQYFGLILGIFCFIAACLYYSKWPLHPGLGTILPVLSGALLLVYGGKFPFKAPLISIFLGGLGKMSYSVYLFHWPIIIFLNKISSFDNKQFLYFVSFIATYFISLLSYKLVEENVSKRKSIKLLIFPILILIFINFVSLVSIFNINAIKFTFPGYTIFDNSSEISSIINDLEVGTLEQQFISNQCFLNRDIIRNINDDICRVKASNAEIMIWGDSHAAALWTGVKEFNGSFNISEFTSSACPPYVGALGVNNSACIKNNALLIDMIKSNPPETLILVAAWDWPDYDIRSNIASLENTIALLKNMNIRNLILVGPMPTWDEKVTVLIKDFYNRFGYVPVGYENFGLSRIDKTRSIDTLLSNFALNQNIAYYSPLSKFCRDDKCLLIIKDRKELKPISLDSGHISRFAAKYVFLDIVDSLNRH